jgi:3-oxoacyl-[acyl-carrier protein] reductase
VLDITLMGTMRMTRAMLRVMKAAPAIVNNASVLSWRASPTSATTPRPRPAWMVLLTRCVPPWRGALGILHERAVSPRWRCTTS